MADIIFSALLLMGIYVILAISLNLINGFTGMFSIGHAAFFGIGAYAAAIYLNAMTPEGDAFLYSGAYWSHLVVGAVLAMIAAAVAGLLIGVPCLRLAGDYLAIATLAFAEIVRIFFESFRPEVFGGSKGLSLVVGKIDSHWGFACVFAAIVVVTIVVRNIKNSATGRAFLAIRENEIAAQVMGINTAVLKVSAFVIGSALAGLAGALFAYTRDLIAPKDFGLMCTIMILLMIVLGGQGSITGAIIGAIVLGVIDPLVRYLPDLFAAVTQHHEPVWILQVAKANPQVIYAVLLILLIRLRPQGIFGTRELSDVVGDLRARFAKRAP